MTAMWSVICSLLSLLPLVSSYVTVPWQTRQYYGFDGPWQAVTIDMVNAGLTGPTTAVDLIPGGWYNIYILTEGYCQSVSAGSLGLNSTSLLGTCTGLSGTSAVESPEPQAVEAMAQYNCNIGDPIMNFWTAYSGGCTIQGSIVAQDLWQPEAGGVSLGRSVSTVPIDTGGVTLPNGASVPLEVGYLPMGMQFLKHSCTLNGSPIPDTWTPSGSLYNDSQIASDSHGLHVGAVAYQLNGSLVFGGYDQSRAIGPATAYGMNPPTLLDMTIGVEIGSSPFSFQAKTGLLADANGVATPVPADIESTVPYLYLSSQTCQNLAQVLPVYFDASSGYYLWNTSSPDYATIVTSPAYLGFVFPASNGQNGNVTIKVPFGLLNLTLGPPAVPAPVAYFPCMPMDPLPNPYVLGRAFLQGAYVVRNHNLQLNWLAQSLGPGGAGESAGLSIVDLDAAATTLNFSNDQTLFAASWANHWTPLPEPAGALTNSTSATPSASTATGAYTSSVTSGSSPSSSSGSSTAQPPAPASTAGASTASRALEIGIPVGIGAAAITAVAATVVFLLRRRSRASDLASKEAASPSPDLNALEPQPQEMGDHLDSPLPGPSSERILPGLELDAIAEIGGTATAHELFADNSSTPEGTASQSSPQDNHEEAVARS